MEGFLPKPARLEGQTEGLAFGVQMPDQLRFVEIIKPTGLQIGDRRCSAGDVVRVEQKSNHIMPVDNRLGISRAKQLIAQKLAKPHPGPATVSTVSLPFFHGIKPPAKEEEVESASLTPAARGAHQAVAPRQKAGAI